MKLALEITIQDNNAGLSPSQLAARVLTKLGQMFVSMGLEVGDKYHLQDDDGNKIGHFIVTEDNQP